MEYIPTTHKENQIHVEGYPDAVKVITIQGSLSKRLADLTLHKSDLSFALECLNEINNISSENHIIRQSLWRSAIIHFGKCFGNSASRFQINPNSIWKGNEGSQLAFDYFKNLRNRHIAHDENSYSQSIPGAILNNGKKEYKIEKIVCFAATAETLNQCNLSNLSLLLNSAIAWVESEFDELCEALTKELESIDYKELLARESIQYQVPTLDDIKTKRKKP